MQTTKALSTAIDNLFSTGSKPFSHRANTNLAVRANENIVLQTGVAVMQEQGRAMLAYTAMDGARMLSQFEAVCAAIAPTGSHRYARIADAYALTAAERIVRWG